MFMSSRFIIYLFTSFAVDFDRSALSVSEKYMEVDVPIMFNGMIVTRVSRWLEPGHIYTVQLELFLQVGVCDFGSLDG